MEPGLSGSRNESDLHLTERVGRVAGGSICFHCDAPAEEVILSYGREWIGSGRHF